MFLTHAIPFLFSKATLRLDRNEDGETVRVADLSLVLEPFPYALAGELDLALADHLFTDDEAIRPELEDVTLNPRASLQRITVQSAPDAPVLAELRTARVLEFAVVKRRDEKRGRVWLKATLVVRIDLHERVVREFLFHHFGETRCFTFTAEQPPLEFAEAAAERRH